MPKITQIRDLTWQRPSFSSFPCFMCGEKQATVRLRIEEDGSALVLQPCLCGECAKSGVEKIHQYFVAKRPK